jgi:HAD superfamily hydrolase (TIGR01509 family)
VPDDLHARNPPELVIFDCDGVLIDSEPIANRVWQAELRSLGIDLPLREVMARFVGRTRDGCLALAREMLGRALPEGFGARWDEHLFDALGREVRPVDGIERVLRTLPVPYCVASNGTPHRMLMALAAAGLLPLVENRLFTASEVAHPKPAPDLFLHAAERMGARPERTVVVEDTPTGVRAGVAAGMRVLAYTGADHADHAGLAAAGAQLFDRMEALPALLGFAART